MMAIVFSRLCRSRPPLCLGAVAFARAVSAGGGRSCTAASLAWPSLTNLWGGVSFMTEESAAATRNPDTPAIAAALRGDEHAFSQLIARYQATITRQMWRFSRDAAVTEELVHDVFVEAWMSLSKYRARAPFEHWLRRIAIRVGYRYWKREARVRREGVHALQEFDCVAPAATESESGEAGEQVHRLLAALPPRDRLVLMLLYLDQCSVEEVAERTGWTRTLVRVQAHRARKKMKALLDAEASESS